MAASASASTAPIQQSAPAVSLQAPVSMQSNVAPTPVSSNDPSTTAAAAAVLSSSSAADAAAGLRSRSLVMDLGGDTIKVGWAGQKEPRSEGSRSVWNGG